ncbi:MAG: hypothetical protein ACI4OU_03355 [Candidatus Enterenecus sp.]
MGDFEEKLESILNNPQAMSQIMSLAQSLGGGASPQPQPPPSAGQTAAAPEQPAPPPPPPPRQGDGLGQLDPKLLSGIASLLGQYNSNDDQRVALLNALRPFVKEKRYAKIDKAVQIAKLSRMIRMALDMFRAKEDGHV